MAESAKEIQDTRTHIAPVTLPTEGDVLLAIDGKAIWDVAAVPRSVFVSASVFV